MLYNRLIKTLSIISIVVIHSNSNAVSTLERTGDIVQVALPITAGLYSITKKDSTGAKQLLFAGLSNTAVVYALKYTVNEKRPNGGKHSFPSGHTAISFVSSTYMWKRYGPEFGIPATLLAGFVGYTRVEARKHFFHDVAAGALIGMAASYFFTEKYQDNLLVTPEGVGVKFSF
jgi:membrane-associated phospholipid phosphatase